MVGNEIRDIDYALSYVDVSYKGEGFIADAIDNVGDALKESFKFILSIVTFDLTKFMDDKIKTDIYKKLRSYAHDVDKVRKVSFLDVKDKEVVVTPGFEKDLYKKVEFLNKYVDTVIGDSKYVFEQYEDSLARFITSSDARKITFFDKSKYDRIAKEQKELFAKIDKLVDVNGTGRTTIGKLIGNIPTYASNIITVFDIAKTTLDEKDLKEYLRQIRNLSDQVNAVIELINTENVKEAAIKDLISANTLAANQYTLLGKFYYLYFEVAQIIINTRTPILKH